MSKVYENALQLIGNTPLVRLFNVEKAFDLRARLYAKVEFFNPTGSVKDRAALTMIEEAERTGRLKKGGWVIEPTSGNTGIGLAMICALKGYRATIVMPDSMSVERQKLMKAYGAEVLLTDGKKGMQGAIDLAKRLAAENPEAFLPMQFDNADNAKAHYRSTGPELYNDLSGKVDVFVATVGTGGTLTGTATYLKEKNSDCRVIAVEPKSSPVLSGGKGGAHKIQGIGAGFVPSVLDTKIYDEVLCVTDEDAYAYAKTLAQTEGLFVGFSSGAALAAAIEAAKREENADKTVAVILPDGGSRYLTEL